MRVIYVTTPSKEVAIELGGKLVEARLAACVNILPAMTLMLSLSAKVEAGV